MEPRLFSERIVTGGAVWYGADSVAGTAGSPGHASIQVNTRVACTAVSGREVSSQVREKIR